MSTVEEIPQTHQSRGAVNQQEETKSVPSISNVNNGRILTKKVFKVIVIGDPNVGKTCLTFRFCNGRFPEQTEATIGVDFRERSINIDGDLIRIQLWDTAGQERFRQSMTAHYYRNVHAVVFVYDVTKRKTFENLSHWLLECQKYHLTFNKIPAIVIGNKCDCLDLLTVPTNDAQKFADLHNMPVFETSAKSDSESDHVESIFMTLVHKLKDSKLMNVHSTTEEEGEQEKNLILKSTNSSENGWGSSCVC